MALIDLGLSTDKLTTSIQQRVDFSGDIATAQRLQQILGNMDIDWEEILAGYTGDRIAFQISNRVGEFHRWVRRTVESFSLTTGEYLHEEVQLTVTGTEFELFQSRVTEIRQDIERFEARLRRLRRELASRALE